MITHFRTFVCAGAALLLAGSLHAQGSPPSCSHGDADEQGIEVGVTVLAHPTRVAATVDSVLKAQGYTVEGSPAGLGRWSVQPRFTWLADMKGLSGGQHPGIQVTVDTDARGDSTAVSVGARALCKVPPVEGLPGDAGQMLELLSATTLAGGVIEALDSLEARGVDATAPVARAQPAQQSVAAPPQLAGFRMVGRHDYEDPTYGTSVRYSRDDGLSLDVYVYPGVRVTAECDAACAVNAEADGFVGDIPELVRAGHYEKLDVTADEPLQPPAGAPWAFGRHLTMKATRRGEDQESHYWLFSMPGFFLKARASYRASSAARAAVQRFIDELPAKMVSPRP